MSMQAQDHLEALFVLDGHRIISTREPNPVQGPAFVLIRRADTFAWAIGAGVGDEKAKEIERLALDESPTSDYRQPPNHMEEYLRVVPGEFQSGPAFDFPEHSPPLGQTVLVDNVELLKSSFNGWAEDEIPGRSPIMAILEGGVPISLCFCARVTDRVAEAGVETAPEHRGRGFAALAAIAWASAIQASGRTPIYSTSWSNGPSLAVARKLGLIACASYWNLFPEGR